MVPWAIVPTAGRGTRLLPATLVVPKVLLPVGTRPMLHWTLEEAASSGARAIVVVMSPGQAQVREYVKQARRDRPEGSLLAELGQRLRRVELHFVEQPSPAGIGEALIRCQQLTGPDPFAVLLPDNWFDLPAPAIAEVAKTFRSTGLDTIGLTEVTTEEAWLFGDAGGVDLEPLGGPAYRIVSLQNKSKGAFRTPGSQPVLRGCARYVLNPGFYEALAMTGPPPKGEWDDVPAFQQIVQTTGLAGHLLLGRHFDVGHRAGYLAAAAYLARRDSPDGG